MRTRKEEFNGSTKYGNGCCGGRGVSCDGMGNEEGSKMRYDCTECYYENLSSDALPCKNCWSDNDMSQPKGPTLETINAKLDAIMEKLGITL